MDISDSNQLGSDDAEIAKVLAGVMDNDKNELTSDMDFEETPSPTIIQDHGAGVPPVSSDATSDSVSPTPPAADTATISTVNDSSDSASYDSDDTLDNIKKDALAQLRPLVDKLNVSTDEKFDTYLLLLRSTDDKTLIAPAYEAAKGISDESRRAHALLDVVKEIDYLSQPN